MGLTTLKDIREALDRADRREALRTFALSSTVNFAKVCGLNPWNIDDLENPVPACDLDTGYFPWCEYAERGAAYLDFKPKGYAKPTKTTFVARDHFKTTWHEVALARRGIQNPYKNNLIFCDSEDKASIRLQHISDIYQSEMIQWIFWDVLFPSDGGKAREMYTNKNIFLRKQKQQKRPTFSVFGLKTPTAGAHFSGVVWGDDLVNEENHKNPEIQEQIWLKLQQVMQYVASPGCEIWISGTRYNNFDAYENILGENSPVKDSIVPGALMMGCFEEDENGERHALNQYRFCWKPEDKTKTFVFDGQQVELVRESLEEKKKSTRPVTEWYAQMENNPFSVENQIFRREQFERFLPCKASGLRIWLQNADNVQQHLLGLPLSEKVDRRLLDRGVLNVAILGDIAYGGRKQNDFSAILVVGQDSNDDWYLMDGWRGKTSVDAGGLTTYFKHVYRLRTIYGVRLPLGIELHAKESTKQVAQQIANSLGVMLPEFHPLKDNSNKNKEMRIGDSLEAQVSQGKIYTCADFPRDVLDAVIEEGITYPNGKRDDTLDTLANARQVFTPRKMNAPKKIDFTPGARRYAMLRRAC